MKEQFNLEQFKAGRKALTRDGRVVEFMYHRPDFMTSQRLGAVIENWDSLSTYWEQGTANNGWRSCDLTYMAPAEHGIEGMPWDMPAPPAPPTGFKWKYLGKGYRADTPGVYRFAFFNPYGRKEWVTGNPYCVGDEDTHYLEMVYIVDPYAKFREARAAGKTVEYLPNDSVCNEWLTPLAGLAFNLPPENYRIKPEEFPPAPYGKEWHNPNRLTPEEIDISNGWRLLCKGEKVGEGDRVYSYSDREWQTSANTGTKPSDYRTYRTKRPVPTIEFPPLPKGQQWHNPNNLTPEQVQVDMGWRLLVKDEFPSGTKVDDSQYYDPFEKRWTHTDSWWSGGTSTLRVSSLYTPIKVRVPLCEDDVPPLSVFRHKEWNKGSWRVPKEVNQFGVHWVHGTHSWEFLMEQEWLIKRPNEGWGPCFKLK